MTEKTKRIRITVVGDGDTGKTCMLIVYKDKKYNDVYIPTVFDSYSMTVPINREHYTVILYDTAGQEVFDQLRRLAYADTDIFLLCYSVDNIDSFENVLQKWAPELQKCCPKSQIILVATKIDLRNQRIETTSRSDGERLAKTIKAATFIETSSKDLLNVDEAFSTAMSLVVEQKYPKTKSPKCNLL